MSSRMSIAYNKFWLLRKTRHWLHAWSHWPPKAKNKNKVAEAQPTTLGNKEKEHDNFYVCGVADTEDIPTSRCEPSEPNKEKKQPVRGCPAARAKIISQNTQSPHRMKLFLERNWCPSEQKKNNNT